MIDFHLEGILETSEPWHLRLLIITVLVGEVLEEFMILFWTGNISLYQGCNQEHSNCFLSSPKLIQWKRIAFSWLVHIELCCLDFHLNQLLFSLPFFLYLPSSFPLAMPLSHFAWLGGDSESRGRGEEQQKRVPRAGVEGQCWLL